MRVASGAADAGFPTAHRRPRREQLEVEPVEEIPRIVTRKQVVRAVLPGR